MLTEPGLGRPTGTTNVLWASQLSTFSSLLGAGHTVDDPSSVTGDGTLDGVEFPSEVAGVPGSVAGVGARTAGSSFPTLVETLGGLSPRLSVVGWGDLGSHQDVSEVLGPGVADHWGLGHVVQDPWVSGDQTIPHVFKDS